ncbi:MAG: RNA polymerase sigma factor [Phycisphaeraceae bacterium]
MDVNRLMTTDENARVGDAAGEVGLTSDSELARRAGHGDRQAAGLLVERYQTMVRHFLRRLTRCSATADDLAQETFVRMLRYAGNYDDRYTMRTWLLTIARRLSINHGRTRGRTIGGDAWQSGDGAVSPVDDPGDRVADDEQNHQLRHALDAAIAELPNAQREAVLLFHQQGLSIRETADVMGVPTNTVKSHLHRGRAGLRAMLGHLAETDT